MNTLQFIDSMTGRLAWPLAVVVLGLVFRRSLVGLLERVRKLRWGEREAELAELAEATQDVQDAVEEAAKPLPEGAGGGGRENRARMERLMRSAAQWGWSLGKSFDWPTMPGVHIGWSEDGQPSLHLEPEAIQQGIQQGMSAIRRELDPKGSHRRSTRLKDPTDVDIVPNDGGD
jgi:hypothetical protein